MLTAEERKSIREKVYPFSQATPLKHAEEIVDKVQIATELKITEKVKQILKDWDEFTEEGGEEKWQAKYGCDTTELVAVIERALGLEK